MLIRIVNVLYQRIGEKHMKFALWAAFEFSFPPSKWIGDRHVTADLWTWQLSKLSPSSIRQLKLAILGLVLCASRTA
jgi:hypothetical protein